MPSSGPAAHPTCRTLGVDFFAGRFDQAVDLVIGRALSGQGGYACLTSIHGLTLSQRDSAVASALSEAWMNFPDGVPVTWLQHRTGALGAERVCGIDLMPHVLDRGRRFGLRHYLYGSTPVVLDALQCEIARQWPGAHVVGAESPPFGPADAESTANSLDRIRRDNPQIIWVGLGAPKQDFWGQHHSRAVSPALVMGVGAAFDFVSNAKRRAPMWMQRNGLEWAHRLILEPRRLSGRYVRSGTELAISFVRDSVRRRKWREHSAGTHGDPV